MREKKKSLRLKKHVIAKLRTFTIRGGDQTNPCTGPVGTTTNPSDACQTADEGDHTCGIDCTSNTTRGNLVTTPGNPCNPNPNTSINPGTVGP